MCCWWWPAESCRCVPSMTSSSPGRAVDGGGARTLRSCSATHWWAGPAGGLRDGGVARGGVLMGAAVAFLTIVGRGSTPDARTMRWFPVVGLVLGAIVGETWWLADQAFTPFLAAALAVAADLAITGLLHVDGLA